jgi:hypothetical protein
MCLIEGWTPVFMRQILTIILFTALISLGKGGIYLHHCALSDYNNDTMSSVNMFQEGCYVVGHERPSSLLFHCILYILWLSDVDMWSVVYCTMFGLLDQFWSPVVHVTPLKTPFGLVIPLLQSQSHVTTITHNYLLTLLRVYTIIILTRSWLQSLITLLHIYTGWLLSYQLLSQIITHFLCLPPIETSLVGLLLTNWLCIAAGLQDISSARTPRKRSPYSWAVLAIS